MVVHDLRIPLTVQHMGSGPGLGHVVHKPVAVIVVPHIFLIQDRRVGGLPGGAQVALVPGGHDLQPIGVDNRTQQYNHVVAYLLHLRALFTHQAPGQLGGHLGVGGLTGMHASVNPHYGLALLCQLAGFLRTYARPRQVFADTAPLVELLQVGSR